MCEINEKPAETMECKCKQICYKMQNDSLRCAISGLKNNQNNSNTILRTLEAICNLLEVYSCLPDMCLIKRVQWVYKHVERGNAQLYESEKIKVNMLISELEAFLNSSNS